MIAEFDSFASMLQALPDDTACRRYLEERRWHGTPVCPHCGTVDAHHYRLTTRGEHRGLYKCRSCKQRFTVTVGTIFEGTKVGLQKWFIAIFIFSSHRKGISSHQLGRDLGVTQKTAWFMLHRIRKAFEELAPDMLEGAVSMDETFVGGKNKNRHADKKTRGYRGGSGPDKSTVIGAMDDTGRVVTRVIPDRSVPTVAGCVREWVKEGSVLITDEHSSYKALDDDYFHVVLIHAEKEYQHGGFSTNNLEGFWSHIKRGIIGIYHWVSKKHLHRYCGEFCYRQNTRMVTDRDRFDISLQRTALKRLPYKQLIAA